MEKDPAGPALTASEQEIEEALRFLDAHNAAWAALEEAGCAEQVRALSERLERELTEAVVRYDPKGTDPTAGAGVYTARVVLPVVLRAIEAEGARQYLADQEAKMMREAGTLPSWMQRQVMKTIIRRTFKRAHEIAREVARR